MSTKSSLKFWLSFFLEAGLSADTASEYAVSFSEHKIRSSMLPDLGREYLRELGVTALGDVISVLKHAKSVAQKDMIGKADTPKVSRVVDSGGADKLSGVISGRQNTESLVTCREIIPLKAHCRTDDGDSSRQGTERRVVRKDAVTTNDQSKTSTQSRDRQSAPVLVGQRRRRVSATPPDDVIKCTSDDGVSVAKQRRTVSTVAVNKSSGVADKGLMKRTVFERLGGSGEVGSGGADSRCQVTSTTAVCEERVSSSQKTSVVSLKKPPAREKAVAYLMPLSNGVTASTATDRSAPIADDEGDFGAPVAFTPRFTVTGLGDRHVAQRQSLCEGVHTGASFLSNVLRHSMPRVAPAAPDSPSGRRVVVKDGLQYQGVLLPARATPRSSKALTGCTKSGTLVSDQLACQTSRPSTSVKERINLKSVGSGRTSGAAGDVRQRVEKSLSVKKLVSTMLKPAATVKTRLGAHATNSSERSVFDRLGR